MISSLRSSSCSLTAIPWNSWGDADYCDTVFIIHGHSDKNLEAPFGVTAHYEEGK